jgi:hypothetical protein
MLGESTVLGNETSYPIFLSIGTIVTVQWEDLSVLQVLSIKMKHMFKLGTPSTPYLLPVVNSLYKRCFS